MKKSIKITRLLAGIVSAASAFAASESFAANVTKAPTGTDLTVGASWVGNVALGPNDLAIWDAGSLGAGLTLNSGALNWLGVKVNAGASDPINIGSGGTITLGNGGVDMSAATTSATISPGLTLGIGNQKWAIATGQILTLNGGLTRTSGTTLIVDQSLVTGVVAASPTLVNSVVPWTVVKGSGASANNSANGYTFATTSGGNIVPYTAATPLTSVSGVWGGIPAGGSGAVNYDVSATAVEPVTGSLRNINTLRYTGGGIIQPGNTTGVILQANAIMNAGTGGLTIATNSGSIYGISSSSSDNELVLAAMTAPIVIYAYIANNGAVNTAVTITGTNTVSLLNGANTYSGGTTVAGGNLSVPSSLTGTTATGAITITDGSSLLTTVSGPGQLTPSSLIVGSSSGATLTFANVSSTTIPPLNPNAFTINGTVTVNISNVIPTAGIYPLVGNYISGSVVLGTLPAGISAHLSTTGNQIALVVDSVSPDVWAVGTGNWDTSTANWTVNGVSATYANGNLVQFDDTATGSGPFTVTITPVSVSPSIVTVNNSAKAYTIGGVIAGTDSLAKGGNGTLTLTGANTFSGGTTLNSGTLSISGNGTLGGAANVLMVNGGTLDLGGGRATNGIVTISGGTIQNGTLLNSSFNAMNGAAITISANLAGNGNVVSTGAGTLTLSPAAGTTNFLGNLRLAGGEVDITSGTINVIDNSGFSTRMESNATLTVSSGATLNIGGSGGWFPVGVSAGQTATIVLNGGTINVTDNFGTEIGNESGSGVLTINSGAFINNDAGAVGFQIAAGAAPGTVNLNGGTLQVNKLYGINTGGNIYFNGGTLKPITSRSDFWTFSGNLAASIRDGGAIVDTTNLNVTIAQALLHSSLSGDNATDGGLTKIGNGTLILSGGYTYTGPTKVLAGALSFNTAQPTPSSVGASAGDLLISNAVFVVDASSGNSMPAANVLLNTGSSLNVTNNPSANALNGTGNLLIQTNTTLNLNYGILAGNPNSASINVAGAISLSGTNNVINISGVGFTAGQFPLIQYGSGTLSSITGFKLGTLPAGVNAVLANNTANHSVDLNITFIGQTLTWYGATNGVVLANWDINADTNWLNSGTTTQAKYLEYAGNTYGDLVAFDDSIFNDGIQTPATNVILTTTVHPSMITMNNSAYPFVFSGPGSLSGPAALNINGSGSVTLTTSNSYAGGTFVNAGTLVITNDTSLGTNTGILTLNGGTIQFSGSMASTRAVSLAAASTVDVIGGATAQLSGAITGGASLTKTDDGTLVLNPSVTNTLGDLRLTTGQLEIPSGTVNVSDTQGTSTRIENNSTLIVSGGTLNIIGDSSLNGWFPIGVTAGSTGTVVVASGTLNVNDHWGTEIGNESGAGVLTINGGTFINNDAGGVGLIVGENGSMGGTLNLNGGALILNRIYANGGGGSVYLNGGTLKPLASRTDFWVASANLVTSIRNGGVVIDTTNFNVTIAQPLLHSTITGDNAVDGGLTKNGSGTLTLAGANTYTGNTRINAGTLELSQATIAANSTVSVSSGAVLRLDFSETNQVAALILNGVSQPAGVYNSSTASPYISGTGSLLVANGLPPAPTFNKISFGGGNVIITATNNGGTGGTWTLLGTNNLTAPVATWPVITNGTFDSNGNLALTNAVGTNSGFFILRVP